MKTATFALLPALASAAVLLEPRQRPGVTYQPLPVAFKEKLEPSLKNRSGVVRELVGYGPITLAAGQHSNAYYHITDGICKECTILKGKAGIRVKSETDAGNAGTKKVYIHHILNNENTKPVNPFLTGCTTSTTTAPNTKHRVSDGSKFIGTGDDQAAIYTYYTATDAKIDAGYQVGKNYAFSMNAALVNEENIEKQVFITMEVEYLPGKVGGDTRDVLLMSGPCTNPAEVNTSTTGPTSTTSGNYFFVDDGTIVYAKGHLHAGGEKMELYINGKLVCTSEAKYEKGDKGPITGITTCPKSIPIKKNDYLMMKSFYDGSKHEMRHDHGMMGGGMMGGSMGGAQGSPDRLDVMGMWAVAFASNTTQPKQ